MFQSQIHLPIYSQMAVFLGRFGWELTLCLIIIGFIITLTALSMKKRKVTNYFVCMGIALMVFSGILFACVCANISKENLFGENNHNINLEILTADPTLMLTYNSRINPTAVTISKQSIGKELVKIQYKPNRVEYIPLSKEGRAYLNICKFYFKEQNVKASSLFINVQDSCTKASYHPNSKINEHIACYVNNKAPKNTQNTIIKY